MKKIYGFIIVTVFLMSTFLAINMYNSTSFPGYGGNKECNYCHNQPAFVKSMNDSSTIFSMNNFTQAQQVFSENNGQWATDEVPTIQTNNRSEANLEFVRMTFIKNSTDIMVMAQVPDSTYNATSSATSDKFGIIFNINATDFSVGQFLGSYNTSKGVPIDQVLTGQMSLANGEADLWYVDMAHVPVNSTGMAQDEFITGGIGYDGATHQDVHVMTFFGAYSQYGHGYEYIFVRKLNTNDPNDAQFNVDGTGIHYAIAHWDASDKEYHMSSFDQMIIVGNNNIDGSNGVVNGIQNTIATVNNNFTSTYSEPASISSTVTTFTIVIVLALVAIAIPIITWLRPKK